MSHYQPCIKLASTYTVTTESVPLDLVVKAYEKLFTNNPLYHYSVDSNQWVNGGRSALPITNERAAVGTFKGKLKGDS